MKTDNQLLKKILITNDLHNLADLITELRKKSGKKWTLLGVTEQNLSSLYHKKVVIGYPVIYDDNSFSYETWEMFFGSVEQFLQKKLSEVI